MRKVKLTQEQAKLIDEIKDIDYAINIHGLNRRPDSPLQKLSTAEIARALYIGYEVEPEYSVGDWVRVNWSDRTTINRITDIYSDLVKVDGEQSNKTPNIKIIEVATVEEVSEEKERRWWKKHNRDVWEIREDDTLTYAGVPYVVDWFNSEVVRFKSGRSNAGFCETFDYVKERFEVFCFAEDRKDIDAT